MGRFSRPRSTTPDGGPVGYPERMLLVLSLAWLGVVMGWLLIPPLLPRIIEDFDLTLSGAGVLLTAFQASAALVLYPSGRISDRLGRATVIVPGLTVFVLGLALFSSAPTYHVLVLGTLTLGVGYGLYTVSSRALISDLFPQRRGGALGVLGAGFNMGGVVASLVALVALARWRLPFAAIGIVLAGIILLFVRWNREAFSLGRVSVGLGATTRRLVTLRGLRGPVVVYSLFFIVTQGFLGFFPTYLHDVKGMSPASASAGFALVFAVGAVSKVTAGVLSDWAPRQLVALVGIVLAVVGLAGLVLTDGLVGLTISTVLFAVGHQSQFPLIDAILMDAVPVESLGGDLGASRTIFRVGGSIGPVLVGVIAQQYDLTVAFVGLLGILVVIGGFFARGVRRAA